MEKLVAILAIIFGLCCTFISLHELYKQHLNHRYALAKLKRGDHFIRWGISLKAKRRYIKGGTDDE